MKIVKKAVIAFCLIVLIIWIIFLVDERWNEALMKFFKWVQDLGFWGPVWFICLYIFVIILILPGFLLTVASGFLFDFKAGSFYVLIAMNTGSLIAFLVGKYPLHSFFTSNRHLKQWKQWSQNRLHQGFWLILATRLIPFFPGKLSNYYFGAMNVSLKNFFWGTFLGIIPNTLINVYLGSLVSEITRLEEARISLDQKLVFRFLILFFGISVFYGISYYLHKKLEMKRK